MCGSREKEGHSFPGAMLQNPCSGVVSYRKIMKSVVKLRPKISENK